MAATTASASVAEFQHPPFRTIVHPYETQGMKSIEYRDYRITRVSYAQVHGKVDYCGFPVEHAFAVKDELGDQLPITQQLHWTPVDAMHAIDIVLHLQEHAKPKTKRYNKNLHTAFEYNLAVAYRRSFGPVYVALMDIEAICREARDWKENPTEDIMKRLQLLRQVVAEGAR